MSHPTKSPTVIETMINNLKMREMAKITLSKTLDLLLDLHGLKRVLDTLRRAETFLPMKLLTVIETMIDNLKTRETVMMILFKITDSLPDLHGLKCQDITETETISNFLRSHLDILISYPTEMLRTISVSKMREMVMTKSSKTMVSLLDPHGFNLMPLTLMFHPTKLLMVMLRRISRLKTREILKMTLSKIMDLLLDLHGFKLELISNRRPLPKDTECEIKQR